MEIDERSKISKQEATEEATEHANKVLEEYKAKKSEQKFKNFRPNEVWIECPYCDIEVRGVLRTRNNGQGQGIKTENLRKHYYSECKKRENHTGPWLEPTTWGIKNGTSRLRFHFQSPKTLTENEAPNSHSHGHSQSHSQSHSHSHSHSQGGWTLVDAHKLAQKRKRKKSNPIK